MVNDTLFHRIGRRRIYDRTNQNIYGLCVRSKARKGLEWFCLGNEACEALERLQLGHNDVLGLSFRQFDAHSRRDSVRLLGVEVQAGDIRSAAVSVASSE